ncbi:MAG TPA: DUF4440 domain-containing protein [Gemmatimonadales bacterium]|nr:DUF4440 domain-containing protein [Gemmatimonadales bacterium]
MRFAMGLLTCLLAVPLHAQQPPPAAELPSVALPPDLDRVLRDYERGWRTRDVGGLAALFTDDGFILQGGRLPARGRDGIVRAYSGSGGPLTLRALAYARGDSVGYIIGGYRGETGGTDDGKFVLALRKGSDGRWLIAADIDNSNRPPRRPPGP